MSRIRSTTALAAIFASTISLGGMAHAQDDPVSALVACVVGSDGAECPEEITENDLEEAIAIIAERNGIPPGQARQEVRQLLEAEAVSVAAASKPAAPAQAAAADDEAVGNGEVEQAEAGASDQQAPEPSETAPEAVAETDRQAEEAADPVAETEAAPEAAPDPAPSEETADAADPARGPQADSQPAPGQAAQANDASETAPDRTAKADDVAGAAADSAGERDVAAEVTPDAAQDDADTQPETVADAQAEPAAEADAQADVAGAPPEPAAEGTEAPPDAAAEAEAETGSGDQPDATETAAAEEDQAEPAVTAEMPGPDATVDEIVAALSGMEDGAERDALLARLQETQSDPETAPEVATEAEAPDAEEQARREQMAREAAEAALQSQALASVDRDTAAGDGAVETQTEIVTDESARSSDEDTAEAAVQSAERDDGDRGDTLRNILGGAAAGFVLGQLLDSGDEVVAQTDDRVIVNRDGEYVVLKDENTLLRRPGTTVESRDFADGSSRTIVTRDDGTEVLTIRAPDGRILYRSRIDPDGRRVVLIDERQPSEPVRAGELPRAANLGVVDYDAGTSPDALARALRNAATAQDLDRRFSLQQVLYDQDVRELMPRIDLDAITFQTGSAAIQPSQAEELAALGRAMGEMVDENPDELFLIEGHTDTVGGEVMNLALSDRRAESVALALAEYYGIPPENMVTQGYGERFLKYEVAGDVRENRRAAVRRITPLIRTAQQ